MKFSDTCFCFILENLWSNWADMNWYSALLSLPIFIAVVGLCCSVAVIVDFCLAARHLCKGPFIQQ